MSPVVHVDLCFGWGWGGGKKKGVSEHTQDVKCKIYAVFKIHDHSCVCMCVPQVPGTYVCVLHTPVLKFVII